MKITRNHIKSLVLEEMRRLNEGDVFDLSKYRQAKQSSSEETPKEPEQPPATKGGEEEDYFIDPNKMKTAKHKRVILGAFKELGDRLGKLYKPFYDDIENIPEEKRPQLKKELFEKLKVIAEDVQAEIWQNENILTNIKTSYGDEFLEKCREAFTHAAAFHLNYLSKIGVRKTYHNAIKYVLLSAETYLNWDGFQNAVYARYPDEAPPIFKQVKKMFGKSSRDSEKWQRDQDRY
jgi:hypothetical protein